MAESRTATSRRSSSSNSKVIGRGRSSEERTTPSSSFGETTHQRGLQSNISNNGIKIAGILDLTNFYWAETIFEVTIDLLKEPNNGFFDEIFDSSSSLTEDTSIKFEVLDGACDGHTALSAYWKTKPVNALIGARCSGASIPLGWMGDFDNVPQISMSSTSAKLSDKSEFPNFSRVVSPDDERGQVGALVSTLGLFDWDRVTIINTDTSYAKDLATSFRGIWKGEVAYAATIKLLPDGSIDESSARMILESAPHNDPANNSKVVLLLAHSQHAFPILKLAKGYFPRDTFWVGSESWTGENPGDFYDDLYDDWYPNHPGYIGVSPFRQNPESNEVYSKFLELGGSRLKPILVDGQQPSSQPSSDPQPTSPTRLPDYAAEYTVDAIVAMVKALATTAFWNDGAYVTKKLRELNFKGLSGDVSFTSEGDRKKPMFSIMNLQLANGENGESYEWVEVGTAQNFEGSAKFGDSGIRGVCFAGVGCGLDAAPNDSPPIPRDKIAIWAPLVIVFLCLAFGTIFWRYRSQKIKASRKAKAILAAKEAELNDFKNSVVDMCTAEEQYVPKLDASSLTSEDIEAARSGSFSLLPPPIPPPPTIKWCWKEHEGYMNKWRDDEIEGNRADRWIKYDVHQSVYIEDMYNRQGGSGIYKMNSDYTINFATWTQTNNKTNFKREVKRVVEHLQQEQAPNNTKTAPSAYDFSSITRFAGSPPSKIAKEPQMVLVPGDIVQISKKRKDNWAYGSKLHLEDEPLGRRLVQLALSTSDSNSSRKKIGDGGDDNEDNKVIITSNHGWFPMAVTRAPDTNDLATLRKTLGGAGDLSAPETWDKIVDPSVVQKSAPLNPSSKEYRELSNSFLMSLPKTTKIVRIHRIQNMAMYQSYIIKRKTVVDRDKTLTGDSQFQQALARFERRWLWHGTNADSVEKIIQQGFNRSFCGKNATVYGKGVYFARDSSYSANDLYSPKDSMGNKYILACSVVVGEFCKGHRDARTPDLRDATKNILYDSTVDNPRRPSLYVTYHDAQCYPDYMIVFKS